MPIQKRIFTTLWALLDLSNIEMMTPISQSNRDGHYSPFYGNKGDRSFHRMRLHRFKI